MHCESKILKYKMEIQNKNAVYMEKKFISQTSKVQGNLANEIIFAIFSLWMIYWLEKWPFLPVEWKLISKDFGPGTFNTQKQKSQKLIILNPKFIFSKLEMGDQENYKVHSYHHITSHPGVNTPMKLSILTANSILGLLKEKSTELLPA